MKRPYRASWWGDLNVEFDLDTPVWVTTTRSLKISDKLSVPQYSFSAALMAFSSEDAKQQIVEAHRVEVVLEWRSVVAEYYGWTPFNSDRPRQPGVIWDQKPH